jgi:riboflavin synthase
MFTGIIEEIGQVASFARAGGGAHVSIRARLGAACRAGDSIAVDGVCLTVTARDAAGFASDLSSETLARSTLGRLRPGNRVNLERPVRAGDPLGGHLVSGHVDAIGTLLRRRPDGAGALVHVGYPRELAPFLVWKGSVAVDGISLTVAELSDEAFGVALIPYTAAHTTLGGKRVSQPVNLEADLIAKQLARLAPADRRGSGLSLELLKEHGYA